MDVGRDPLVLTFGLLGNIISFIVFLAPLPTFLRIWKNKSTEGFQSLPYIVSLFSAMLWLYYAYYKTNETLLITINSVGCVIETIYIAVFVAFAAKQTRIKTLKLLMLLNLGGFCVVLFVSHFVVKGSNRVVVLGWICVSFAVSVFAAPLTIMRVVIRTKSVEFMPFSLSLFLTISAITWLLYGVFLRDIYVVLPNILGFLFGVAQMILYAVYKNHKPTPMEALKLSENKADIAVMTITTSEANTDPKAKHKHPDDDIEMGKLQRDGQQVCVASCHPAVEC